MQRLVWRACTQKRGQRDWLVNKQFERLERRNITKQNKTISYLGDGHEGVPHVAESTVEGHAEHGLLEGSENYNNDEKKGKMNISIKWRHKKETG